MYGCECWTVKKADCWKMDAFELWCWKRFLRVPWTARRSNQSILKEISSEYSLKGLTLKLKLQYFGHLVQRTDSLKNTLMLGKTEGERRGQPRMRWLDGITDSMDMGLGLADGQGGLACCGSWGLKEWDMTARLNWTELMLADWFFLLCVTEHSLCSIRKLMLLLRAATRYKRRKSSELVVSSSIYYSVDFWQMMVSPFLELQNRIR